MGNRMAQTQEDLPRERCPPCLSFPTSGLTLLFGHRLWHTVIDALPPQSADALAEDLGIEFDLPEHSALEKVLVTHGTKRKRD